MHTQSLILQARAAYAPLVAQYRARGYSTAQTRGALAALLVLEGNLPRGLAHAAVLDLVTS